MQTSRCKSLFGNIPQVCNLLRYLSSKSLSVAAELWLTVDSVFCFVILKSRNQYRSKPLIQNKTLSWRAPDSVANAASCRSNVCCSTSVQHHHDAAATPTRWEWKKNTPWESVFIIIQVPSGYLLRVGVAGPSGRWLAGLPGGPRSARAGGGRDTNTEPEVPSDAGPWSCYSATGILARSRTLHCACKCLERWGNKDFGCWQIRWGVEIGNRKH